MATILNIEKLHNVSKSLHCLLISQSTNSTLNESLIIYLCYKFSEYLVAAFLVVYSILR